MKRKLSEGQVAVLEYLSNPHIDKIDRINTMVAPEHVWKECERLGLAGYFHDHGMWLTTVRGSDALQRWKAAHESKMG